MNEELKVSCSCGKHDFIFAYEPWCKTEVQCPVCGEITVYEPESSPKKKRRNE